MSESNEQPISISTISRLKTFTDSLINRRERPPPLVFPPPSWELDDSGNSLGASSSSNPGTPATPPPPIDPPEPVSFAKRLRSLIEALPIPSSNSFQPTAAQIPQDENQFQTEQGKQGTPVPPELDENLLRMLSSEDIMNGRSPASGSTTPSARKQSIWSALAGLGKEVKDRVVPTKVEQKEEAVMMYAPLQPDNNSQLQLAESESVLEYIDEPNAPQDNNSHGPKKEILVEKQVWVPSTTQLSVLTTWWGYRLYLPPPVMHILDATSLKATARAAMITSALKWVLDKLPLTFVPPQFRGAVTLLKRLGPVVGYVGVFISWSWNRIRTCDKGNGVVLTATWLLPVALIPMAWDAGDIYGPPLPPKGTEIKLEADPEPEVVQGQPQEQPAKKEEKKSIWRYRW